MIYENNGGLLMRSAIRAAMVVILSFSLAGCGRPGVRDKSAVLARIGNEVITLKDFNDRISNLPDNIKAIAEQNKAAYLENLVIETLLYKEALDKKLDQDAEVKLLLDEAKKRILIARLAEDEIEKKISVNEQAMRDYYEENKDDLSSPELFRASHILVDTLEEAAKIQDRLNAGAIFEELAREYSKDVTSKRGGDIGYFSAGQMVPEFEDACMKLKVGEISGPVKTNFGYHIIKLTDKRGPEPVTFEEAKDKIERIIATQDRGKMLDNLVERLKQKTKVTMNAKLLEESAEPEKK